MTQTDRPIRTRMTSAQIFSRFNGSHSYKGTDHRAKRLSIISYALWVVKVSQQTFGQPPCGRKSELRSVIGICAHRALGVFAIQTCPSRAGAFTAGSSLIRARPPPADRHCETDPVRSAFSRRGPPRALES